MIISKGHLKFYMDADKYALEITKKWPSFLGDDVWKYQIILRKLEYYKNTNKGLVGKVLFNYYRLRKYRLGIRLGFDIPPNVFGPGLRINHHGNIVVNAGARVGRWCDIHQGVNIGTNNNADGSPSVPVIGDNVWIGPGAKIFGNITINDGAVIGANAVVNRDVEANTTVAGVPAKTIRNTGSEGIDVSASICNTVEFFKKYPQYEKFNCL